jgi:uncharacterized protein (UPF0276 family)
LGVGLEYQSALRPFIEGSRGSFDFLEIIPDLAWADFGPGHEPRYQEDAETKQFLEVLRRGMPIICHSIGLSIGSAHQFDLDHVAQLACWYEWLSFPWQSDHLSYNRAEYEGGEINVGLTLPLPLDGETLDLLVPRIRAIQRSVPVPFALENNVYFFELPEMEFAEPEFLNLLCERADSYLLLDLHNLYVNSRNLGLNAHDFVDALDLDRVVEIHVAGGMERDGFYLDAHSGPVPEPVWKLLDAVLPRCRNLGGVVFELLGSWYDDLGETGLSSQLSRLKEMWSEFQPKPESTPSAGPGI